MPITRSAKKAHRASLRRRVNNVRRKKAVTNSLKALKKLAGSADKKALETSFRAAQKALDKAAKANTITKNAARRKKSRLAKLLKG